MILHILRGLQSEYESLRVSLCACVEAMNSSPSFYPMMPTWRRKNREGWIGSNQTEKDGLVQIKTNLKTKSKQNQNFNLNFNCGGYRGWKAKVIVEAMADAEATTKTTCKTKAKGTTMITIHRLRVSYAKICLLYTFESYHPPHAYNASTSKDARDDSWYPDLRASHQISLDLSSLSIHSSHSINDLVQVGNHIGLAIKNCW